jgi:multiple sugar transport system permease protein
LTGGKRSEGKGDRAMAVKAKRPLYKRKESFAGFLFAVPALVLFAMFAVYPIVRTVYISFFDYNMLKPPVWKGIGNYTSLFTDPLFGQSVRATIVYTLGTFVPTIILALTLALLLNSQLKGIGFFRTLYFTPVVMSMVVVAIIWKLLFSFRGPINQLLSPVMSQPIAWLSNTRYAPIALSIMGIWKNVGYFTVIYLAGLQGIPREFREAARVDGASPWQLLRYITLPLLRPITVFVTTMAMISGMQEFTAQYVMTGGGPNGATRVISLIVWETAFVFMKMGRAAAMCVLLFLALLIITVLQKKWLLNSDY